MRSRFPALRTLPSSTVDTLSRTATSAIGIDFPLKANDELRDDTCKPGTCTSALMISSVIPSLKYSLSGSAAMVTKGSTAIDFSAGAAGAALGRAVAPGRSASENCATGLNRSAGVLAKAELGSAVTKRWPTPCTPRKPSGGRQRRSPDAPDSVRW